MTSEFNNEEASPEALVPDEVVRQEDEATTPAVEPDPVAVPQGLELEETPSDVPDPGDPSGNVTKFGRDFVRSN